MIPVANRYITKQTVRLVRNVLHSRCRQPFITSFSSTSIYYKLAPRRAISCNSHFLHTYPTSISCTSCRRRNRSHTYSDFHSTTTKLYSYGTTSKENNLKPDLKYPRPISLEKDLDLLDDIPLEDIR